MFIVKLSGGLGNQMFEHAFGRAISLEKKVNLFFDIEELSKSSVSHETVNLLNIFPIKLKIAKKEDLQKCPSGLFRDFILRVQQIFIKAIPKTHIYEKDVKNCRISKVFPPAYLEGLWANYRYFDKYSDIIKKDFTFPKIIEDHNKIFETEINIHKNSVSVHIRRGDYILNKKIASSLGILPIEYYQNAINLINEKLENPHFFFFSDDTSWVKENFNMENMTIVTGNNNKLAFRDMQLMSMCKHHIIANSTFSWWGAWLGNHKGITIGPMKWTIDNCVRPGKFPLDWIAI